MGTTFDRRTFLQGASAATLASMMPGATLAAPISAATAHPMTNFNGGRSQVNLNFLQTGGDYPFLNCLKNAQSWSLMDNSGQPTPDILDPNGYPITIKNGGVYTVFQVPSQAQRPGNYVITWDGNGTIFCQMQNTPVSGSLTSTNGSGRYVFSTTSSSFGVGISAIGNPYITNLRVFHVNDEAALKGGQVFCQQFIARLKQANFGVIRFLNWQSANGTNVTTWSTRKPVSYVFYAGQELRGSIYAGLTTNVGNAYSATLSGFTLADKATVIATFNASASTSSQCTLNVNGTGAIPILDPFCSPLAVAGNSFPVSTKAFATATLVYDATLNAWIKHGGDVGLGSTGLDNGCPPEVMVQLCAQVGAHPYFVTPQFAADPLTDYMPSLAGYCLSNGPSWMIPRFEGPNECWNYAFEVTYYANAKATAYGWGADGYNWYGKVMSVLGQAISNVYSGNRSKYQVLCGIWTADWPGNALPRLTSAKYVAQSAPAQSPYTKSPASNWVTHICIANYYSPSEYGTTQEATDAAAFAALPGNTTQQASIANNYAATANSGTRAFNIPSAAGYYLQWKAFAQTYGIQKMCCYEGGYSPDYTAGGTSPVDQLRAASKLAPCLSSLTTLNYNNFVGLSDPTFTAEFPSCFQLSGQAPSNNAWSVLEDIYQSPNPPQWNAIVAFNSSASNNSASPIPWHDTLTPE